MRAGEATGRPVLSLQWPVLIPTCPQPSRRQALPSRSKERGPAAREAGSGRQVSISSKSPRRLPHPRPWQGDAAIGLPVAPLFRTECSSLQCWSLPLWDGWAAWPEIARTGRTLGPQWGKKKNHSAANDRLSLSGTQRLTDVNRGHIVFSRNEKTDQ